MSDRNTGSKSVSSAICESIASADGVTLPAAESDPALLREGIRRYVLSLMDADRKVTALKHLQGLIWTRGYLDGRIIGHVYEDVPAALEQWNRQNISVWIYSSGSIAAQKLLFGHTEHGSLLKHFSGHFDTTTGPKTEVESYRKIAAAIGSSPEQILFVTDILKEAVAAREAGMRVNLAIRPGNAELSEADRQQYTTITDFSQISV
ncbi:Enolase-phosphatase E1 [Amphibalanus amphitrite]|uniref:Enolase-phosphatase E1 n=1 Tax=Amphibalanus amphitrite TaxID=1232801 RepID=A0A6A4X0L0_AMPAM|nr:Enolase-phosphatase E1 [Amphibalanus amphitrite]